MRKILLIAAVAALGLAPTQSRAVPPSCAGAFRGSASGCAFTYLGGAVLIAGVATPGGINANRPLGRTMLVQVDLFTDLRNPAASTVAECANSSGSEALGPFSVANPALCAGGAPSVPVATGQTIYCEAKGSTGGVFACVNVP